MSTLTNINIQRPFEHQPTSVWVGRVGGVKYIYIEKTGVFASLPFLSTGVLEIMAIIFLPDSRNL